MLQVESSADLHAVWDLFHRKHFLALFDCLYRSLV
nr:MAG TPA: hypothetical protein [Caudoviricetes sp.]